MADHSCKHGVRNVRLMLGHTSQPAWKRDLCFHHDLNNKSTWVQAALGVQKGQFIPAVPCHRARPGRVNHLWACHWFAAWLRHLLSPAPPAGLKGRPDDGSSSGLDLILASAWDIWALSVYFTWTSDAPNDRTREICWDSTLLITGVTPSLCWYNYSCRSQLLPCVVWTPSMTHQHREKLSNAFLTWFSSLVWVVSHLNGCR